MPVWVSRQTWGDREDYCIANGVACAGWVDVPDFREFQSVEEVKAFFGDSSFSTLSQLGKQANSIWRFANEVDVGQLIAMPSNKNSKRVHLGRVNRTYWYERGESDHWLRHRVGVDWLCLGQERSLFSTRVQRSLSAQDYFYRIGAETAESEFTRLLERIEQSSGSQ